MFVFKELLTFLKVCCSIENIIYFFTKQASLMRRSTALSPPPHTIYVCSLLTVFSSIASEATGIEPLILGSRVDGSTTMPYDLCSCVFVSSVASLFVSKRGLLFKSSMECAEVVFLVLCDPSMNEL